MNNRLLTPQLILLCSAGLCLSGLTGCVSQDDYDMLQAQVQQQQLQIQQLSAMRPAQADTWAQVQQLRQEMAAVQGAMDNFNNSAAAIGGLDGLVAHVNNHQQALQRINTQFALDLPLPVETSALSGSQLPSSVNNPQPPFVQPATGNTSSPANPSVSAPAAGSGKNAPAASQIKQPADTATALYDTGLNNFNKRRYQEALNSFTDFTKTYPRHALAGNAYFWRGESNFAMGRYSAAVLDYEQVISKYPQNAKAASCYMKQGLSFIRLGNKDAARVRLNDTIKKFPKSPEAARAQKLLQDLK